MQVFEVIPVCRRSGIAEPRDFSEADFGNIPVSAEQVERASVSEWFSRLVERDRIVLTELSEGRERKEIARSLNLSIGSFNNYMSKLIRCAQSSGVIT